MRVITRAVINHNESFNRKYTYENSKKKKSAFLGDARLLCVYYIYFVGVVIYDYYQLSFKQRILYARTIRIGNVLELPSS